MHPAWEIEDIWLLILEHLEPRDLARLSQTCNLLFNIASNELWKTITNFSAFLGPLPRDCLRRPLQPNDVERLHFYSGKVRKIVLQGLDAKQPMRFPEKFKIMRRGGQKGDRFKKTWAQLWEEVALQRPTTDFLPNLRQIRIDKVGEELLLPLVGISGLNLEKIYIKYMTHNKLFPIVSNMLDRFQSTPKLEYLFVRDGEDGTLKPQMIRQSPLQHLRMDPRVHPAYYNTPLPMQYALRAEIFRKATIQHLTIGLTRDWYFPEVETMKGYLPNLKTLWLDLTKFKPTSDSCARGGPNSWTCAKRDATSDRDCGRRSPAVFFQGLGNPELSLLNIKFPDDTTASMFFDVIDAARESCRLENLTELGLAGGGLLHAWCWTCRERGVPNISAPDLREGLMGLLPLPRLKTLRLSVGPNFLDQLDLELYKTIASGLPALRRLWLSHAEFARPEFFMPMQNLAAFCSMLPQLDEVSVGAIDGLKLSDQPRKDWASTNVKTLQVAHWEPRQLPVVLADKALVNINLATYFPNADMTRKRACIRCRRPECAGIMLLDV